MDRYVWGFIWYIGVMLNYKYVGPEYAAGCLAYIVVVNGYREVK